MLVFLNAVWWRSDLMANKSFACQHEVCCDQVKGRNRKKLPSCTSTRQRCFAARCHWKHFPLPGELRLLLLSGGCSQTGISSGHHHDHAWWYFLAHQRKATTFDSHAQRVWFRVSGSQFFNALCFEIATGASCAALGLRSVILNVVQIDHRWST